MTESKACHANAPAFIHHFLAILERFAKVSLQPEELRQIRFNASGVAVTQKLWKALLIVLARQELFDRGYKHAWAIPLGPAFEHYFAGKNELLDPSVVQICRSQLRRMKYTRSSFYRLTLADNNSKEVMFALAWVIANLRVFERFKYLYWEDEKSKILSKGLTLPPYPIETVHLYHANLHKETKNSKARLSHQSTNLDVSGAFHLTNRALQELGRVVMSLKALENQRQRRNRLLKKISELSPKPGITPFELRLATDPKVFAAHLDALKKAETILEHLSGCAIHEKTFLKWLVKCNQEGQEGRTDEKNNSSPLGAKVACGGTKQLGKPQSKYSMYGELPSSLSRSSGSSIQSAQPKRQAEKTRETEAAQQEKKALLLRVSAVDSNIQAHVMKAMGDERSLGVGLDGTCYTELRERHRLILKRIVEVCRPFFPFEAMKDGCLSSKVATQIRQSFRAPLKKTEPGS